ncbi:unnamed protein product [Amoebophrya sp. A120]|nr:unnamed protein product [Amoebophrya sp. A120]|eukprot:GSA120T00011999001.1
MSSLSLTSHLLQRYATKASITICSLISFVVSTQLLYDPEAYARGHSALAPSKKFHVLMGRFVCAYEACALSLAVLAFSSLWDKNPENRVFWCRMLNIPVYAILVNLLRFNYDDQPDHPMFPKQYNAPIAFAFMAAVLFPGSVLFPETSTATKSKAKKK